MTILLILGALCLAWQRDTFEKSKQHALKGQKYIAQGNALGKKVYRIYRPVRATLLSHR